MRGDPPEVSPDKVDKLVSTPHARGSTQIPYQFAFSVEVYPACAGIHPSICADLHATVRLPRMRGDPPTLISAARFRRQSTPHARGSTSTAIPRYHKYRVYPACAGIHLPAKGYPFCGKSTPHARGSTVANELLSRGHTVYPACAGIHRKPRAAPDYG